MGMIKSRSRIINHKEKATIIDKPNWASYLKSTDPSSYYWVDAGLCKCLLVGTAIEAACVTGIRKVKNPVAKAGLVAGAAIGAAITAAGGMMAGAELEAYERETDVEEVEDFEEDDENEDEPEESEDDGVTIE